jgi:hypothetical protein
MFENRSKKDGPDGEEEQTGRESIPQAITA